MAVKQSEPVHLQVLRRLMCHVVPIYFELRKDEKVHQIVYTSFAFSVRGRWLLLTAGHCITDMKTYRDHGYELVRCRLADTLGPGAQFKERLVPFDYDAAMPTMLCKDPVWDYGFLVPSTNTCRLLQANQVVPLDEKWWAPDEKDQSEPEAYYLVGLPAALTEPSAEYVKVGPTIARVEPLAEAPEEFASTNAPMFYGRLYFSPLQSLKGFSGSPIFSFFTMPDGSGRYGLHAMQVSAVRNEYISGMLIRPFGEFLRQVSDGKPLG